MLKKGFILLSVMFCVLSGAAAQQQNPQAFFDEANQYLQQGDITRALDIYNQLEDQNQISGALFLNMGLSYIRVDSMGKAKYYFMKASRFEETRERAQQGLEFVDSRFSRQSAVLPTLPWQEVLNWLESEAGPSVLLAIGILLLNGGIFLYILTWFRKTSVSLLPKVAVTIAAAGALVVLLSLYVEYRADRYQKAVMVTSEVTVREQPAPDAAVVSQAFEGYTFSVDQSESRQHQDWSYIQMSNGQYGWIPTKEIMIL